jgi:ubiquitin-protein ligase
MYTEKYYVRETPWTSEITGLPYPHSTYLTGVYHKEHKALFKYEGFDLEMKFRDNYPKCRPELTLIHKGLVLDSTTKKFQESCSKYSGNCVISILNDLMKKYSTYLNDMNEFLKKNLFSLKYVQLEPKIPLLEELENLKNQNLLVNSHFDYEVEMMEDNIVRFETKKHIMNFEFPQDYPDSPPIIEFWKTDLKELQTNILNKIALNYKGKNSIFDIIKYYELNSASFEKIVVQEKKKKLKEEEKEILKLASDLGIDSKNIRIIKSELEIKKGHYLDPKLFEYKYRPKKEKETITVTEKEREKAKNVQQASSFSLQKISVSNNQEMNSNRVIEILSHLKALSSYIMMIEHQIVASKDKVIVDAVKLVKYFSNEEIKWNAYVEEILIYGTYIASVLCNQQESISDLMEMRVISSFWTLSKRMRGEIRHHLNIIIEKCGKSFTFSMDIFKLFNQPSFSDFKFICSDETIIHAHKFIIHSFCENFDLTKNSCHVPEDISSAKKLNTPSKNRILFFCFHSFYYKINNAKNNNKHTSNYRDNEKDEPNGFPSFFWIVCVEKDYSTNTKFIQRI